MKISEVTEQHLKDYANVFHNEDDSLFKNILAAGKAYIKGYTGLDDTKLDSKEDMTMVLFVLSNELYDNRTFTVENDKVNTVIKSILDMHSVNLL
jgi:uncharacterized phage protein (predicted DNA packaging)